MNDPSTSDSAFRFFQQIAEDLSGPRIVFPTFLQASSTVREALAREDWSSAELAQLVSREPLLSARVVALANSAALNPSGVQVSDVRSACLRAGHRAVRSLAASMLVEQAARAREMGAFAGPAREIWEHSLAVGVMAFVLAEKTGYASPDEAMFAGLVHDLGHFYLYWQATRFKELAGHPDRIRDWVHDWHAAIGQRLLLDLKVPEIVARACEAHEEDPAGLAPGSLSALLCVTNRCTMAYEDASTAREAGDAAGPGLSVAAARALLRPETARIAELLTALMGVPAHAR